MPHFLKIHLQNHNGKRKNVCFFSLFCRFCAQMENEKKMDHGQFQVFNSEREDSLDSRRSQLTSGEAASRTRLI